nr:MAG TPA: hypothetical protein [Siphoviridae sp. ctMq01]
MDWAEAKKPPKPFSNWLFLFINTDRQVVKQGDFYVRRT